MFFTLQEVYLHVQGSAIKLWNGRGLHAVRGNIQTEENNKQPQFGDMHIICHRWSSHLTTMDQNLPNKEIFIIQCEIQSFFPSTF